MPLLLPSFFAAPAAQAEVHDIMIFDDAYDPSNIYIEPGKELLFVDSGSNPHNVVGEDDAWEFGNIGVESTFSINVTLGMPLTFSRKAEGDDFSLEEATVFNRILSYDEPPHGD